MPIVRPLTLPLIRPLGVADAGGASPAPATYATWNSADKDASVVLSLADLRAAKPSGGGWGNVRATIGKASGKWRWRKLDGTGAHLIVGVGTIDAPLGGAGNSNYLGADANGWGFYVGDGNLYSVHNGSVVQITSLAQAAEVELRLNVDANTLSLVRGVDTLHTFDVSSRGSATLYPMQSLFSAGPAATANFGPDNLGTPVAGYNDGVFE